LQHVIIFNTLSQYGVVDDFVEGLRHAVLELGYTASLIDVTSGQIPELSALLGKTAMALSINAVGADLYSRYPELETIDFYTLLIDHPVHLLGRFFNRPLKLLCVDKNHVRFCRALGAEAHFFPHAIWPQRGRQLSSGRDQKQGILFPATYISPDYYLNQIEQILPQLLPILQQEAISDINSLLNHLGFMQAGKQQALPLTTATAKVLALSDLYLRALSRQKLIDDCAANHIKLTIIGNSWQHAVKQPLHHYLPAEPFPELLNRIAESKYVLHHNPGFLQGQHERILYSMLLGTAVISEKNDYLTQRYGQQGSIILYQQVADLCELANAISPQIYQELTSNAQQQVLRDDTWLVRLQQLRVNRTSASAQI